DGVNTVLQGPEPFKVEPLFEGSLPRKSYKEMNDFREEAFAFQQDLTAANIALSKSQQTVDAMLRALNKATAPSDALLKRLNDTKITLMDIDKELHGDEIKGEIGERSDPTASDGNSISWRALGNTYGPTDEHKAFLSRVQSQLKKVKAKLLPIVNSALPALESDLKKTGAPWIEGQGLIKN
ncbi:MAG: glycosyl hydrolase, partial [Flavobacteriaceae bacterium]|nr:glycosyl hydrolase [Bacteroidia bacterium]NNL61095.1 glycosyl hydrolase [Flavobacteriaceae bacterium]